ncbi:MAG: hypothetical protein IPK66_03430 [Rhodospirillales bacterium]|nr:hypothetical protein [Rhodospirillales bacterium]
MKHVALLIALTLSIALPAKAQETSGSFTEGSIRIGYDDRTCDASLEGSLRYNSGGDAVEVCSPYRPKAIHFDGVNDWLSIDHDNLSGIADSNKYTISFWLRPATGGCDFCRIFSISDNGALGGLTERFVLVMDDADANNIYDIEVYSNKDQTGNTYSGPIAGSNEILDVGSWYHVLISYDGTQGSDPARLRLYINDSDQQAWSAGALTAMVDFASDFSPSTGTDDPFVTIGGFYDGPWQLIPADLADFWFNPATAFDLTNVTNRRKFIDAAGGPVYLGADGSLPTGTAPLLFLSGPLSGWPANKGTGGGFISNGTLSNGASPPGASTSYEWRFWGQ